MILPLLIAVLLLPLISASSISSEDLVDYFVNSSDYDDMFTSSSDEENVGSFIEVNSKSYPIMPIKYFQRWNESRASKPAAFLLKDVLDHPSIVMFNSNGFNKYHKLSNLATVPFKIVLTEYQSVESCLYSNVLKNQPGKGEFARRLAEMDGRSARQVGKYFPHHFTRSQVKDAMEAKLVQHQNLYQTVLDLIGQGKLLVCTDETHFDWKGLDLRWGMIRHGEYLVGENLVGRIYHEIYKETTLDFKKANTSIA